MGASACRLVEDLRDLIRIPTVNPPGDEILAARHVEAILADAGIPSTVVEPFPGRGSVAARLHGDGTGGGPLLLLGHLDVVPAPPELWTHDPFAADVADGYVYGRGAVDMKDLVAMELGVMRLLAAEARAAGPRSRHGPDPRPAPRHPVRLDRRRGGRRPRRCRLGRRQPPRVVPGRRGDQRVRRRLDRARRRALLPDPGRREGLHRLPVHGPRHVGPRIDAARRQRCRPRRPDRRPDRAPGPRSG